MRISDWSSDVCSSDLLPDALPELDTGTGSQSQTSRIEETVNYEITKTVKTHIREAGMVRRLSVAVMVNGDATTDAEGNPTYEPRSVEEMEKITALVRSAVGYRSEEHTSELQSLMRISYAVFCL